MNISLKTPWITLGAVIATALLLASSATTAETIYRKDALGNETQTLTRDGNGRWIRMDQFGNKLYHLDQYKVEGDRAYAVDTYGNTRYHEPSCRLDD